MIFVCASVGFIMSCYLLMQKSKIVLWQQMRKLRWGQPSVLQWGGVLFVLFSQLWSSGSCSRNQNLPTVNSLNKNWNLDQFLTSVDVGWRSWVSAQREESIRSTRGQCDVMDKSTWGCLSSKEMMAKMLPASFHAKLFL